MNFNISQLDPRYDFRITGASYAGKPKSNTVMFISKKVERFLSCLEGVSGCLVFVEDTMEIPEDLQKKHCFILDPNPQRAYADFLIKETSREEQAERQKKYTLTPGGYYVGEDVVIGENAWIEPGVLLGHGIRIGRNAVILSGAVIKHAVIGDDFFCNEKAVIGENAFTMAEDDDGHKYKIPTAGEVVIGDHVEIGACDVIARGSAGDTIIEDHVKISALCVLGHDVHIGKNTEIIGGCDLGGFVDIGENCFLGICTNIKNRITVGDGALIGMGSVVIRDVESGTTVCGNPAKPLIKKA